MNGIVLLLAGLGIVLLASAIQPAGTNWLGQACAYPGRCFHPEWLLLGALTSAIAYIVWRALRRTGAGPRLRSRGPKRRR